MPLDLPEGHTAILVVLSGHIGLGDGQEADAAEVVLFSREGSEVALKASGDATLLVLTGAPLDEPIVGYGPFVMNTQAEILRAFADYNEGRFGQTG